MKKMFSRDLINHKALIVAMSVLPALAVILILPVYLRGEPDHSPPGYPRKQYQVGQDIPPGDLSAAVSLSAGRKLDLDERYYLFLSNIPEMPNDPGILCSIEDVMSPSGMVRVLFSHLNLLIDWSKRPVRNIPATAGFCLENRTSMKLNVYAERGAFEVSRAPLGKYLFLEDKAPVKPGSSKPEYFGSAVGNWTVQQWFLSGKLPPVLLGSMSPGGRIVVKRDVGPRGWITGIYDLKFYESSSGLQVGSLDFKPGEKVSVKTFIAPVYIDINTFLDKAAKTGRVLPPSKNEKVHMRGLFVPGRYPDGQGEAISKKFDIDFSSSEGRAVSFALAAGEYDQGESPDLPSYVPDVFVNDSLRNGKDPSSSRLSVNGGNYGVDYTVNLNVTGPAALVAQGAVWPGVPGTIDLYNQILTFELDGKVNTIQIKDPSFNKFYTDFSALGPQGCGRVVAVFPEEDKGRHVLRYSPAPNGYGPVRFYLLPM
ncbi:MAG: hypothetical protein JL50_17050 [Peptococcaceae bacterium BICA1-7]|nr:MAG: hypothetical protein JL50_17050 [Peptococcaceae bacterium BICA1-7]HBV96498.1 hypothetical protein [Desulfotomaculum sp.]